MFRGLTALFFVISSFYAEAITVSLNIQGDHIRWQSAFSNNNGLTTSYWELAPPLDSAKRFTQVAINAPNTFNVTKSNISVPISVEFLGASYYLSSPRSLTSFSNPGNAQVNLSGNVATVLGVGKGNKMIEVTGSNAEHPFSQFRPIFDIDESALKVAFQTVNASEGYYTGQVPLTIDYDYVRENNVLTRSRVSLPLVFSIYYQPAEITRVEISSPTAGKMTTIYQGRSSVSGRVEYNGEITGTLPRGARLSFPAINSFAMTGPSNTQIPISILCQGCDDTILVSEGVKLMPNSTIAFPSNSPSTVRFSMIIKFDDQALDGLNYGAYSGVVHLLFEPEV